MKKSMTSSSGRGAPQGNTSHVIHITCSARAEFIPVWRRRFGVPRPRSNVRYLASWRRATGHGHRTGG
jgi:hypothetical protein